MVIPHLPWQPALRAIEEEADPAILPADRGGEAERLARHALQASPQGTGGACDPLGGARAGAMLGWGPGARIRAPGSGGRARAPKGLQ
jgi:hypothetical protein